MFLYLLIKVRFLSIWSNQYFQSELFLSFIHIFEIKFVELHLLAHNLHVHRKE